LRAPTELPVPGWPTAGEAANARLFSPLPLGRGVTLTTRTWVPAMVPWRANDVGSVNEVVLAWYRRLAAGRPGAIVTEATGIRDVPSGPLLRIGDDRFVPGLAKVAHEIKDASQGETRSFVQLIDYLRIRRRPDPGRYLREFLMVTPDHARRLATLTGDPGIAAADPVDLRARLLQLPQDDLPRVLDPREHEALTQGARQRVTDLDDPEIRDLPHRLPPLFASAAARARAAGFDGVELHAAHGYTLASFLSPLNHRADGYGGDRDGRVRVLVETCQAVRAAVGPSFIVGARLLGDEVIAGGGNTADATYFAVTLGRAGLDFISVSKGGKFEDARQPAVGQAAYPYTGPSGAECLPTVRIADGPFGRHLPLARALRDALRAAGLATPVVAAGGLHTFRLMEDALQRGDVDACGAARQTLADPDWVLKMRLGRGDEIRRCQLTNYCEGLDQKHRTVTCRLWDRSPIRPSEPDLRDGPRRLVAPTWASR
jgi:2,4-dienoyl-CoA reductase-like NADH-dependent reductase (Old Yellow Enzyme family)